MGAGMNVPGDVELAITKEEMDAFDQESEARRLQWLIGGRNLKPKVIDGRRVAPGANGSEG